MDKHLNCNFTNISKSDISKKLYDGLISNDIEHVCDVIESLEITVKNNDGTFKKIEDVLEDLSLEFDKLFYTRIDKSVKNN